MPESPQDSEIALTQLIRLISELLRGTMSRNCFRPWEIDLLLDIESSNLRPSARRELLRRYQKAVRRHFENESGPPPRLSEFLEAQRVRRARDREASAAPENVGAGHDD
jgi:hypothetical protein